MQSDPIGLLGGVDHYSYAGSQPSGAVDKYGLRVSNKTKKEVLDENCIFFGNPTCECCGMDLVPAKKSIRGESPPSNEIQFDHIKAVSKGGGDGTDNIQVRARKCNRDKSNNDEIDYRTINRTVIGK